jgi:hypothetical protein
MLDAYDKTHPLYDRHLGFVPCREERCRIERVHPAHLMRKENAPGRVMTDFVSYAAASTKKFHPSKTHYCPSCRRAIAFGRKATACPFCSWVAPRNLPNALDEDEREEIEALTRAAEKKAAERDRTALRIAKLRASTEPRTGYLSQNNAHLRVVLEKAGYTPRLIHTTEAGDTLAIEWSCPVCAGKGWLNNPAHACNRCLGRGVVVCTEAEMFSLLKRQGVKL